MVTHPVPYVVEMTVSVPNFMRRDLVTWEPCSHPAAVLGGQEVASCEELHGVLRNDGMSMAQTLRRVPRRYGSFRIEARVAGTGQLVGMAEWVWCLELLQYRQWDVFTGCEWGEHGWLAVLLDELGPADNGPEGALAA
ncbi:hypothetical protein [Kitasatospora purpeofusca]|uniref:hypothetical protein n=1 Tax=Kitasatospora purpeofusca TaxID=67352 RepID=UPI0037FDB05E